MTEMAGSHSPSSWFQDPVVSAWGEALQLLAEQMCARVLVIDRDFRIVYANETSWTGGRPNDADLPRAKCYEVFRQRTESCASCPAMDVLRSGVVRRVSCAAPGDGSGCGMRQAFPLLSSEGKVESALVLFGKGTRRQGGGLWPAQHPGAAVPTALGQGRDDEPAIIGTSPLMSDLVAMARLVADSEATVLLQGESGTGKGLLASAVHRWSPRRREAFVVVDCSTLPEPLLESELFGHVRGAFTGAVTNKAGLFEVADGGTVFLDEIADTTPTFQAKLLRVLQEGEVKPVGSTRVVKVNVRVIAASNKNLGQLVQAGGFRQDLYYRLSVFPLWVPALRDRREDIPQLAEHFLRTACARHRREALSIAPDAMAALRRAAWPGNVRELQHVIERAVITWRGGPLAAADLLGPTRDDSRADDLWSVGTEAKRQAERERIVHALGEVQGNRSRAARLLRISRASLYNKLRRYGLE